MALRWLVLAALFAAALLAIGADAMSGEIVVVPRDLAEPLEARAATLLELFQNGKDAAGEIERSSVGGACAGCHTRSLE